MFVRLYDTSQCGLHCLCVCWFCRSKQSEWRSPVTFDSLPDGRKHLQTLLSQLSSGLERSVHANDILTPALQLPRQRTVLINDDSVDNIGGDNFPQLTDDMCFYPNPIMVMIKERSMYADKPADATNGKHNDNDNGDEDTESDAVAYFLHSNFANENAESMVHVRFLVDPYLERCVDTIIELCGAASDVNATAMSQPSRSIPTTVTVQQMVERLAGESSNVSQSEKRSVLKSLRTVLRVLVQQCYLRRWTPASNK